MGAIVWIASYPKSGNTWMRVFIEHLLSGGADVDLNNLRHAGFMASSRRLFDQVSGVRASDLTEAEIESMRSEVYRTVSERSAVRVFLKAHDAYEPRLIPADPTEGAIHLIRNPLDIVVSYAHHVSTTPDFDEIVTRVCSSKNAMTTKSHRLGRQLTVRTGDWSSHVRGWSDDAPFRVVTLRYEDLLADPMTNFARAAELVDPDAGAETIAGAVKRSSFERLRAFERERGFLERGHKSRAFFRSGRSGTWREQLTPAQVNRVIDAHGAVMQRFGYLDPGGNPVDPTST